MSTVVEEHGQDINRAQGPADKTGSAEGRHRRGCSVSSIIVLRPARNHPKKSRHLAQKGAATIVRIHALHASARVEGGRGRFGRKPRKANVPVCRTATWSAIVKGEVSRYMRDVLHNE
ncbi:hypothetical protein BV898_05949 [Hypsibius exemplaris]|uniref:Uncharacterized protein n=1 Tax=Hypsibius exemplaris TaxID=2072580 RepID=A0A1W0WXU9_HYPEX|nr:hypothetical protein BV898_05949 [Hypsibius exemplaris]